MEVTDSVTAHVLEVQQATGEAVTKTSRNLVYSVGIMMFVLIAGYIWVHSHLMWKTLMRKAGTEPEANVSTSTDLVVDPSWLNNLAGRDIVGSLLSTSPSRLEKFQKELQVIKTGVKLTNIREGTRGAILEVEVPSAQRPDEVYCVRLDTGETVLNQIQIGCTCKAYQFSQQKSNQERSSNRGTQSEEARGCKHGLAALLAVQGGRFQEELSSLRGRADGSNAEQLLQRSLTNVSPAPPPGLDRGSLSTS